MPEETRDETYFNYYAMLTHQQNMLQDYVRTGTYQSAITKNVKDFKDKIVLDVGAGSGILSFFCAHAGAKKVYAVEASPMAKFAAKLVLNNNLSDKIVVIEGKIEEIDLPEKVDIIISEPIGVLLLHERMIESYLFARNKFLKSTCSSSCQMYPSKGHICFSPFTDALLFTETMTKARFWEQQSFYGIDLSSLKGDAMEHYFCQPVVGVFDAKTLFSAPCFFSVDFQKNNSEDLFSIDIPIEFKMSYTGIVHGMAGWFDIFFEGSENFFTLSTSPANERTHWHQIRFLFHSPIAVNASDILIGAVTMKVNQHRSYDVDINLVLNGTNRTWDFSYRLHEQQYSYLATPTYGESEFRPEFISLYERH